MDSVNPKKSENPKITWKCSFPYCSYRGKDGLHYFPKDLAKRVEWMLACKLTLIDKNSRICDLHFEKDDFCKGPQSRLKSTAVPKWYTVSSSLSYTSSWMYSKSHNFLHSA